MKHILYGILATLLMTNVTFGQSIPSTDEAHRIMMNTYATKLDSILTAHANGVAIDVFKKQIASGYATLSPTVQENIIAFARPLKNYGTHFADINNLTAPTDAYLYFYSSFAPSTVVQADKLVESTTAAGLTATEMWTCALTSFSTDGCGLSALVSDKSNLNTLATACVGKLTTIPAVGDMGVLVMVNGFGDCMSVISVANHINIVGSFVAKNKDLIDQNRELLEQVRDETQLILLFSQLGFQDVDKIEAIHPNYYYNIQKVNDLITAEMTASNLGYARQTTIYQDLLTRVNFDSSVLVNSFGQNDSTSRKFWGSVTAPGSILYRDITDGTCFRKMQTKHYAFWICWKTDDETYVNDPNKIQKVPADCDPTAIDY